MNVRKLLQTELWSKRTTRKILVIVGIVFGIAAVIYGGLYAFEKFWLSPGERSAGKVLLQEIDNLQSVSPESQEFEAGVLEAKKQLELAKNAGITLRDDQIATLLDLYLSDTEMKRSDLEMKKLARERHIQTSEAESELKAKTDSLVAEMNRNVVSCLHKVLN
jgi:hypothetical protein